MCVSTRIENAECDVLLPGLMNAVDQLMLGIALESRELMAQLGSHCGRALFNGFERVTAVERRFTRPQQVQVRAIEQQEARHSLANFHLGYVKRRECILLRSRSGT